MVNEAFKGILTKFGTKVTKDGDVLAEFVITHKSTSSSQDFLDSLSKEFNNTINKCLDNTEWKNITFDLSGVHLQLVYDEVEEMKMPVELVSVKIVHKESGDEEVFTYSLTFNKILNPNVDSVFATTYLKRKEEDDNGKMSVKEYDVLLTK
jgi:hypothetical protein